MIRTVGEELKNFRANPESMRNLAGVLLATALIVLVLTTHSMAYQDEVLMEQERIASRMPPARPIFEDRGDLLRLTPPVRCARLPDRRNMGREWIRQWGDGALPPMMPTCVNARRG